MAYKVAYGHDVAEIDMTTLTPQPKSRGIQATRRSIGADGSILDEGLYIELVWEMLPDATAYQDLLMAFGLSASTGTKAVTVLIPSTLYTATRYNGTAVRPEIGRDGARENYLLRNVTILVKNLEASA